MSVREVHDQAEYDAALADTTVTEIRVLAGVDLTITATGGDKWVDVGGSATIRYVGGSATIRYVGDSATIGDVGGSATIGDVGGSATIRYVGGSATIGDVRGSATIRYVGGSATIGDVGGSATIGYVGDSATIVVARGTVVVQLYDRSSVGASSRFVCVYLRSATATVAGDAHVIDLASVDESDPVTWCEMHGVEVLGSNRAKRAVVYKAVDDAYGSGHGSTYTVGGKVEAPDWQPTNACGAGLHFGPTVRDARDYAQAATRFLACEIRLDESVGITERGATPKIKARSCRVLHEVDEFGERLLTAEAVA